MTAYARTAALVWLKDIADSEVGFRDQYTPEEERKLAASALQIIEEQEERIAIMAEGGDAE